MFSKISEGYDKGNAVLSFGMHKLWNRALVRSIIARSHGNTLLDLCAGTGDISLAFIREKKSFNKVILLDFCEDMLTVAREKLSKLEEQKGSISYICADAQEIPLPDACIDMISMAYGIRNIKDPRRAISDAYRVLKSGGVLAILELTRPTLPLLKQGHSLYLRHILPILGKWITTNQAAYNYLQNSIQDFSSPEELKESFVDCGFYNVATQPLMGGIASIIIANKP